ncbi:MAG: hypothetical protein HLUCCA11_00145 [Phormidesmis priestleyi Ana]|uniref:Uncharacterized protein n=1 Tax=Phormidesmis priestleyi Ana TaxID=1666911 RepID=A0A0N8KNU2_9CYAN|nr:MAG: hypothetical protein HLUCCA11_00145 [Phormidesmis priestleyi Ana]
MENTDTQSKQAALDNKSAFAGNGSPKRERGMEIDDLGESAGLDIQSEEPLAVADSLHDRDQERYELNVDSKESLQ